MLHYFSFITHPRQHYKTPQYHVHSDYHKHDITEFRVSIQCQWSALYKHTPLTSNESHPFPVSNCESPLVTQELDRLVSSFGYIKFTSVLSNVNYNINSIQRSTTAPDLQTPKSSIESCFAGPKSPKIPAKGSCRLYCSDLSHNCNTVHIALEKWVFIVVSPTSSPNPLI